LFHLLGGPTVIDADVARTDPAEVLKRLLKCCDTRSRIRIARAYAHQNADLAHSVKLLRARREWPRHSCTAEQRDELAPSHVGHGGVLPPLGANEGHGLRLVRRASRVSRSGRQVLGQHLKCSEWRLSGRYVASRS